MMINIIMAVCMYPILIIMYFVYKNFGKNVNGTKYGISLKSEWIKEDQEFFDELDKKYKKEMKTVAIISFLLTVPCYFIPYVSIQITIWIIWTFAIIVILVLPQIRTHKVLSAWKEKKGYSVKEDDREVFVELVPVGSTRTLKTKELIIPIILGIIPVIVPIMGRFNLCGISYSEEAEPLFVVLWITFVATLIMLAFVAKYFDNARVEILSNNSDININYSRAKKLIWKKFWLITMYITAVFNIVLAAFYLTDVSYIAVVLFSSILYGFAVLAAVIYAFMKMSALDKVYAVKKDLDVKYSDDDRHWIWGFIYYNPKDKRKLVPTRLGMGTSTNLATPFGKIMDGIAVLTFIGCMVAMVYCVRLEFTPISLVVEDSRIEALQLSAEYEINVEDIEEISLITERPNMSKVRGAGLDNLLSGTFYVGAEGRKCEVFLNPQNEIFIRLVANDKIYYLGGRYDSETQAVYDTVISEMK